jgi:hypothetical protein
LPRPTTARMIPPRRRSTGPNSAKARNRCLSRAELGSSNPFPSSAESAANPHISIVRATQTPGGYWRELLGVGAQTIPEHQWWTPLRSASDVVLNRFRLTSNIGRLTINLEAYFIQVCKFIELSTNRVGRRGALGLVQCRLGANPDLDLARCRPRMGSKPSGFVRHRTKFSGVSYPSAGTCGV